MSNDLISTATRNKFREYLCLHSVLSDIEDYFDNAAIDHKIVNKYSGQRKNLITGYYSTIDFNNLNHIQKLLHVYENILFDIESQLKGPEWLYSHESIQDFFDKLLMLLKRDGYQYSDGKIFAINNTFVSKQLSTLESVGQKFDYKHLLENIDRIQKSVDKDPSLAIGSAKELIETTCKTILKEAGKDSTNFEISKLIKETTKVLNLVPENIPDEAKGASYIKMILSNLGSVVNNIAELRNLYGSGHGKDGKWKGLTPRHAKLAVGAATTVTQFLFETYQEQLPFS